MAKKSPKQYREYVFDMGAWQPHSILYANKKPKNTKVSKFKSVF